MFLYRLYPTKYVTKRKMGGADENGPKWCWMHHLGTRCVFFLIFVFISYLLMFYSIYIGCTLRNMQQRGWWRPEQREQAQMMLDASFGPQVSVFLTLKLKWYTDCIPPDIPYSSYYVSWNFWNIIFVLMSYGLLLSYAPLQCLIINLCKTIRHILRLV